MITIYYQQVWFEGDSHQIKFSDTSLNDPDEMPGMELLEVDGEDRHRVPSRIWEQCKKMMDPKSATTEEDHYRCWRNDDPIDSLAAMYKSLREFHNGR